MNVTVRAIILLLASVLLLPAASPAAATGPRIAFPDGDTRTNSFSIPVVISLGKASPSGMRLSVNGRAARIRPYRGAATATVPLSPGKNIIRLERRGKTLDVIRVEVVRGRQDGLFSLHPGPPMTGNCRGCHPKAAAGDYRTMNQGRKSCQTANCHPRVGRSKKFVHGPLKKGECLACHNPHGTSSPAFTSKPRQKLCFSCHTGLGREFDRKVVHFPVKKGECLSCHDPHESDQRFHLRRKTIQGLCAGCHGGRQSRHEYLHEPVAEGDCIVCHDPHVADYPGLLAEKGNDLCFTCHELRKEEFNSLYVHKPVRQGCTTCHDPHGSAAPMHLRTTGDGNGGYLKSDTPVRDLCLSCHDRLNPETSQAIRNAPVPHKPVAEGKCLYCHTPHSTNFPRQLKDMPADLCYSCHKDMGKKIKKAKYRHGPVRRGNCAQCHQVHGGSRRYLLVANFSTDFYGDFSADRYALCFSCHNRRVYTEENNTETGFRNGDRSLHAVHVKAGGRGCRSCHDIHASNQPRHIRNKSVFRGRYKVTIRFRPTPTGGGCVTGCHRPRSYDRKHPVSYGGKKNKRTRRP